MSIRLFSMTRRDGSISYREMHLSFILSEFGVRISSYCLHDDKQFHEFC